MNLYAVLGWILASLLWIVCNSGRGLVDSAQILLYEWKSDLAAGSLLPTEHISKFQISGSITLVISETNYYFQLTNVSSSEPSYSIEKLALPFAVNFSSYEEDISFKSHPEDEVWSSNIKRSIASLFQFNLDSIRNGGYSIQEENTYGRCLVEYIVNNIDNGVKVLKLINEMSCVGSPTRYRSNTPLFACPFPFQEGIATHSEREYTVLNRTEREFIDKITASGVIHFQPFQALAEAHHIFVRQTLNLLHAENNSSIDLLSVFKNLVPGNITFIPELDHAPISGPIPANRSMLNSEIYSLLEELANNLNWELSTRNLDNQTSFHILELMWWLNLDDWENLYNVVILGTSYTQETIQHFFWDLIPQVGSESSALFIKNLVKTKRIKGFSASSLLTIFPLHMKYISEKFLTECNDLLQLNDFETEVKHAALLGFATMVHRACDDHCSNELVDRYTKLFLDKFMESENYQDKMIYLQALSNMQLTKIFDFLSPVISNPAYSRHIRSLAIGSTMSIIHKHPDKVTKIFWPIFMNRTEPLEIRVAAFSVLIITQPTINRLLTLFWYMKSEPNYHLYNFFFTTLHSFADTKYPCYSHIRHAASQLSRYLLPRAQRWATGNYVLDYEDATKGYGGLIHLVVVASEVTGLPNSVYLSAEQHSHGLSSRFTIYFKIQGVVEVIRKEIFEEKYGDSLVHLLKKLNLTVQPPEQTHFEVIVKLDGSTVYCKYLNHSSLQNIVTATKQAFALYYEFSINYQRLRFPLRYETIGLTDLGTPFTLQLRTASLLSLRGSIKQAETGKNRDAELDVRYSMDTVTGLKTYNPLSKIWHGTDRTRSLHMRIPFSMHLLEKKRHSIFQITANRHKGFIDGSLLGLVWHSTITLLPENKYATHKKNNFSNPYNWSITSRDLGATLAAEVFDCHAENDISSSLMTIKEAFQLSNKNYKSVIGGTLILGIYSLANYFTFLPPGDSCGIIISVSPSQVQLVLLKEGDMFRLSMMTEHENNTIWYLNIFYKEKENEGITDITFQMLRSSEEKTLTSTVNNTWGLIQFEGYFKIPSYKSGVLKALDAIQGQTKISWGHANHPTSVELTMSSDNTKENWPVNCVNDTTGCLQAASNLATLQTVTLQCVNLPIWVTTALLSIFPNNVQADKKWTNIQFAIPAKSSLNIQSMCVMNSISVLNFDNNTIINYSQQPNCYTIMVADCSEKAQFLVGLRKSSINNLLEMKVIYSKSEILEIVPTAENISVIAEVFINGTKMKPLNEYRQYPPFNGFTFRTKYWEQSKMIEVIIDESGLTLQYYGHTVVAIAFGKLRGTTCGLCGDFNGETSNDQTDGLCVALDEHFIL